MFITKFRWTGILLILIVMCGGWIGYYFSRKYMHPINLVAKASDLLKEGNWTEANKIEISDAADDMKNLILLFNSMAREVQQRERVMKNAIRELEMKIDKEKEERLVNEITETDFFKNLELKSKELKKNRKDLKPN